MTKKILLIIDPQYSFLDNGDLPVKGSKYQMDCLSEFINAHGKEYNAIIITADNHPINHCSFKHNGGIWPTHCVQHTVGAAIYDPIFVNANNQNGRVVVLTKGEDAKSEEYSIMDNYFSSKEIIRIIEKEEIEQIDICGIMSRFCVLESIKGLVKEHYNEKINVLIDFIAHDDNNEALIEYCKNNEIKIN